MGLIGGPDTPIHTEKLQNSISFLRNTGPDPLENNWTPRVQNISGQIVSRERLERPYVK